MINISQAKKIRRDICRTMGHEWIEIPVHSMSRGNTQCTRCKKTVWTAWAGRLQVPTFEVKPNVTVSYKDLQTKRFNILDRAKDRASDGDKT